MTKKNVLLVVVDQWRGECVPHLQRADGRTPILKTPNLDRLCAEGTTFRNHVTTTVPCGPARASLLTGLYQMNHRACQNTIPLDARHDTLPRALRRRRLRARAGRLHHHHARPAHHRAGRPALHRARRHDGWLAPGRRVRPGPRRAISAGWRSRATPCRQDREDIWLPEGEDAVPGATDRPARIPAALSDSAYLHRARADLPQGARRQAVLPASRLLPPAPAVRRQRALPRHVPRRPTWPPPVPRGHARGRGARSIRCCNSICENSHQAKFFQRRAKAWSPTWTRPRVRQMRATYFGMMTEVDDQLGRVFAYLDETGQWDDTLIVFTSDHGEQLGDHHLLGKIGYFDESFRIPLVIKAPRRGAAAGSWTRLTESVDLMPTMLDWLGADVAAAPATAPA